uniref:Transcriptional regulator-like domain-containing protein n=1 Tax=Rhodopseudomonas palustris (strain DX-1) TaxID=652103 RepID=E6VPU2_RHOPX
MVAERDWRDPTNYGYLSDLNPAGLAWEFLRRNPEYENEVTASNPADDRAAAALTAHWGLRFPDSPKLVGHRRKDLLEPGRRPGRPHSDNSKFPHLANDERYRRNARRQSRG